MRYADKRYYADDAEWQRRIAAMQKLERKIKKHERDRKVLRTPISKGALWLLT